MRTLTKGWIRKRLLYLDDQGHEITLSTLVSLGDSERASMEVAKRQASETADRKAREVEEHKARELSESKAREAEKNKAWEAARRMSERDLIVVLTDANAALADRCAAAEVLGKLGTENAENALVAVYQDDKTAICLSTAVIHGIFWIKGDETRAFLSRYRPARHVDIGMSIAFTGSLVVK